MRGYYYVKTSYTHVKKFLLEIAEMKAEGKTHQEIANHFGFQDKYVVKELLKRERRKEKRIAAGIVPKPEGRPRKDSAPRDIVLEQQYEIRRLKMENELLRDFLHLTGRR